ncbi:hypothetical protein TeGR_g8808 [Tetraparma gracilis]|uniref:EGF-like domain-containing protein n=1 Tax=Tetraparma gracilis TaxID=2962635 RepID=A0ABQ6MK05_9STRA|nr:hypothetical protein TeGR_g8808 [Tetraparma gracilis]
MPPAPAAALFCIMLLSSALSHGASACSSALDCALSGDCVSGTCACDAAWSGPSCTTLNLVPMAPTQASSGAYRHATQTSWGANVLFSEEDNQYHMFVAEMANNCTLTSWIPNSQVTHATSPTIDGPYKFVSTLFETFHHNPRLTVDPATGDYLLFMIGGDLPSTPDCSGIPDADGEQYDTRIVVSSSPSLLGPWSTPSPPLVPQGSEDAWDYVVTNPSPIILQNGTTLMYYRGTPKYWNSSSAADGVGDELIESVGLAIAPHYLGPYTKPFDAPVLSYMNEDPFAYQDERGFHLLMHGRDDPLNTHVAWSPDGLSWSSGADIASGPDVELTDGTTVAFKNRERPQLFFDPTTNKPTHLFNGVCPTDHYGYAYTMVQEIQT